MHHLTARRSLKDVNTGGCADGDTPRPPRSPRSPSTGSRIGTCEAALALRGVRQA